jgi:micrococcal nuclease
MYEYRAGVIKVVDGDTVDLRVELGFGISIVERFRLAGIDAPEMRGESRMSGLAAKAGLSVLLAEYDQGPLIVRTEKDSKGKYGRYLATLVRGDVIINAALVSRGHAEYKSY